MIVEVLSSWVDFILHFDTHLDTIVREYGTWTYIILFAIVFCETGLVVTPFLPGDSLLFAAGAMAGGGALDPIVLVLLLTTAAIVGDAVNYSIGSAVGVRAFREGNRFLRPEYLARTESFYARHGGKTIVLARFVPIVRTYAPFVAGAGRMRYRTFLAYNAGGGVLWVVLFVIGGYAFGQIPIVEANFELVVLGIIFVSILPMILEVVRHRRGRGVAEA